MDRYLGKPLPFLHGWRKIPGDGSSIGVIVFSPDATLIATGDDKGMLSIWQAAPAWRVIRKYFLRSRIRGLCWNPIHQLTLFVGCASGCLYTVRLMDIGESANVRQLPGYIHSLAINESASKLAIGYTNVEGVHIAFVEDPCGDLQRPFHHVPFLQDHLSISIPHNMYFLNEDVLLISYFGPLGIHAHRSSHPYERLWTIKPRQDRWIAGAALSPSGSILAATNMDDGIDWYSITRREYVSTTYYDVQGASRSRRLVGITFLDEVTVLAGHVNGHIVLATTTMTSGPRLFTLRRKPSKSNLVQVLPRGIRAGDCHILAALGEGRDTTFVAAFVTFPDVSKPWVDDRINLEISQAPSTFMKAHREASSEVNLKRNRSSQRVPKQSSTSTIILLSLAALASMLFIWHDVLQAHHAGSRLSNKVNLERDSRELTTTPPPASAVQTTISTVSYTTTTITTTMTVILLANHTATVEEPTTHSSDTASTAIRLAMALLVPISILAYSSFKSSRLATPSDPAMFNGSLDIAPFTPPEPIQPTTLRDPECEKLLSPSAALQRPIGQTSLTLVSAEGQADDSCPGSTIEMVPANWPGGPLSCDEETLIPQDVDGAPRINSPDCQLPPNHSSPTTIDEHRRVTEDARAGDGRTDDSNTNSDPRTVLPDMQKAPRSMPEGPGMRRRFEEDFALPSIPDEEIIIDPTPEVDNTERLAVLDQRLKDLNES